MEFIWFLDHLLRFSISIGYEDREEYDHDYNEERSGEKEGPETLTFANQSRGKLNDWYWEENIYVTTLQMFTIHSIVTFMYEIHLNSNNNDVKNLFD